MYVPVQRRRYALTKHAGDVLAELRDTVDQHHTVTLLDGRPYDVRYACLDSLSIPSHWHARRAHRAIEIHVFASSAEPAVLRSTLYIEIRAISIVALLTAGVVLFWLAVIRDLVTGAGSMWHQLAGVVFLILSGYFGGRLAAFFWTRWRRERRNLKDVLMSVPGIVLDD